MNIEEFRTYCLSFKGVREKMPFPNVPDKYSRDVLCFYIGSKWFCYCNIEVFDFCCLKCKPDKNLELQATYLGIRPGWHMNKRHWISVYFNQDVPDETIKELVQQSYDIVYHSLSKKEKTLIDKSAH
jgi:predicted DNA-binding protein (MmcQ/YjbR family)